jgi:hypothetical protein
MIPTVTTLGVSGWRLRERMVWSASTTSEATTIGSTEVFGAAPWACRPLITALKRVADAMVGPGV